MEWIVNVVLELIEHILVSSLRSPVSGILLIVIIVVIWTGLPVFTLVRVMGWHVSMLLMELGKCPLVLMLDVHSLGLEILVLLIELVRDLPHLVDIFLF